MSQMHPGMAHPWRFFFGLVVVTVVVLFGGQQCSISLGPASSLRDLVVTKLPGGQDVLVAHESVRFGDYLRFDVLDVKTGERVRRIAPTLWNARTNRTDYVGEKGSRQWWGERASIELIDLSTGATLTDETQLIAANPVLLGELHAPGSGRQFRLSPDAALVVNGGSGQTYAIDIDTLQAAPFDGKSKRYVLPDPSFDFTPAKGQFPQYRLELSRPGEGALVRSCKTITRGPCTVQWLNPDHEVRWVLSDAALHGNSVLSARASDADTVYLEVDDWAAFGFFTGQCVLLAVDLKTGVVRWERKL